MKWFDDIRDTLSKRLNSQFGGTFILVWFVFNWKLIFILFNFDNGCTLENKLSLVNEYIDNSYPCQLLWQPLLFTILSVFSYSVLSNITYAITSFFKLRVQPFILSQIDEKVVVDRERHTFLREQFIELEAKYDKEKATFIRDQKKIKELSEANDKLTIEVNQSTTKIQEIEINARKIEQEVSDRFNNELNSFSEKLNSTQTQLREAKIEALLAPKKIMLGDIFRGVWNKSSYSTTGILERHESFQIVDKTKYAINGAWQYNIDNGTEYDNYKFIEITKRGIGNNENLYIERLIKIADNYYVGMENNNTRIEYHKSANN